MATEVARLVAKLEADVRDFDRGLKKAEKRLDRLDGSTKKANRGLGSMRGAMGSVAAIAGVGFGLQQAVRFIGSTINAASNLEESVNAVNVVFGDAANTITDFAADTDDAVFLAASKVNELATVTGSLLQNFGFNAQQAADETINLTKRAADMASVFNVDVEEALTAINAALRGETEPIRRFGVNVDEVSTKARALELNLIGTGDALDMNAKVAARMNLIMEQTAKVQGDAENTAGSFANQMRALSEELEAAKVKVGQALIPAVQGLLPLLIDATAAAGDFALKLFSAFGIDAAIQAMNMAEAVGFINEALEKGDDPLVTYANAAAFLVEQGELSEKALKDLARAAGVADDNITGATLTLLEFVDAEIAQLDAERLLSGMQKKELAGLTRQREILTNALFNQITALDMTRTEEFLLLQALGLLGNAYASTTDEVINYTVSLQNSATTQNAAAEATGFMNDAMFGAINVTEDLLGIMADPQGHMEGFVILGEDVEGALDDAAEAAERATRAMDDWASANREATSPMLRSISALETYERTLEDVQADGKLTSDELGGLLGAVTALDEAQRQFAMSGVTEAVSAADTALDLASGATQQLLNDLGLLDGTAVQFIINGMTNIPDFDFAPPPVGGGGGGGGGSGNTPTIEDFLNQGFIFQRGGVVPGPVGAPALAMVHGGEVITNPHRRDAMQAGGNTVVVPISIGGQLIEELVIRGTDVARRRGRV